MVKDTRKIVRILGSVLANITLKLGLHTRMGVHKNVTWRRILRTGVHEKLPVEQTQDNGTYHTPIGGLKSQGFKTTAF
jgi:hypothetical protein